MHFMLIRNPVPSEKVLFEILKTKLVQERPKLQELIGRRKATIKQKFIVSGFSLFYSKAN